MAQTRSPSYPQISLSDAIERIKIIYSSQKWHPAPGEILAEHLGYKGLNGSSLGLLSTLKRYGLLEQTATKTESPHFKVSKDAITMIEAPKDSPDYISAIKKAAFRPAIFAELHNEYEDFLPAEQTLRYFLINKKYNPAVVKDIIRVYRETLEFVSELTPQYTEGEDEEENSMQSAPHVSQKEASRQLSVPQQNFGAQIGPIPQGFPPAYAPQTIAGAATFNYGPIEDRNNVHELSFTTLEGKKATVFLPLDITQESVDLIAAILAAQKVAYPTKAQQIKAQQEATQAAMPPVEAEVMLDEEEKSQLLIDLDE